jgi:hypothetical protein
LKQRAPAPAASAGDRVGGTAVDADVDGRAIELSAAQLQLAARAAAMSGDWTRADASIAELRELAADNAWLAEAVKGLAELARLRDLSRFGKESHYAAYRSNSRLADANETVWSVGSESAKPSYLRRKARQGKAMPPAENS